MVGIFLLIALLHFFSQIYFVKWRKRMMSLLTLLIVFLVLIPSGEWILWKLENFHPLPNVQELNSKEVEGFIFLGGAFDRKVWASRGVESFNPSGGRFVSYIKLMRQFNAQNKSFIFSGKGSDIQDAEGEAELTEELLPIFGIDKESAEWKGKILFEAQSRNTIENAKFTAKVLKDKQWSSKRWVLVTSAYHLPRSVMLFREAGVDVIAYPVDYHTESEKSFSVNFSLLRAFFAWQYASTELAGITLLKLNLRN